MTAHVQRSLARTPLNRVVAARRLGAGAFVIALGYLLLLPLYFLQRLAIADGARGYRTAFTSDVFWEVTRATLLLALGSLMVSLFLGTVLAFAASALPRRLRFLQVVPLLPIVLPPVATLLGWTFLLAPRAGYVNAWLRRLPWWSDLHAGPIDVYSMTWIVILSGIGLSSFVYAFVSAGLRNVNADLVEAARVSGSNERAATLRVVIPVLRPVFVYATGVVFLLGLGQFTAPLLLGRQQGVDVYSIEMYYRTSSSPADYATAAAFGSPLLLMGLAMVVFQRRVVGDQRRFVTHGGKRFSSGARPSLLAGPVIFAYGLFAVFLPMLVLVDAALSGYWSGKFQPDQYSLEGVREALSDPRLVDAVRLSVSMSLIAVAISLPLGFVVASAIVRRSGSAAYRTVLESLIAIPLVVPAVVFGTGFLIAYSQGPIVLYGSKWVVLLVYITLMCPFTTRMQMSAMVALGEHYAEASRTSGAGRIRTDLRIVTPLLRPALGGAAALMFVLLSHEFAASLLVRSPKTNVMGTVLYDYYRHGNYSWAATMALLMALITTVGLVGAVAIGGRRVFDRL